jgi:hypothetical protein
MGRVDDVAGMKAVISRWLADPPPAPAGRWALELVETGELDVPQLPKISRLT